MVWGVAAVLSSTDTMGVAKVICRTRGSQTRSAFRTIRFFKSCLVGQGFLFFCPY